MTNTKAYLSFSHPVPGPAGFLFKKAAEAASRRLREMTVEEHREAADKLAEARLIAPGARFEQTEIAGVACEWICRDDCAADSLLLYLHGGSWCFGNLKTARAAGVMLSAVTGLRVLVADYRLAPEHPFPAGLDDCHSVYQKLLEAGNRVAVFGDSAGGNLALALTHRLIAEGGPLPAALGLASPVTDMTERGSLFKGMPDILYTRHDGREQDAFSLYCRESDRESPLISPVRGELEGFPPMLIHVGQDEDLCLDCDIFASEAYSAGALVSLKIWRGMYHDFTITGVALKESRQSLKEFGEFFKLHIT